MYPKKLIDKCLRMYLDKKLVTSEKDTHHDKKEMKYITLPYIGYFSKCTKKKINRLVKQFCQNSLNIQLIFTTCKLKTYFSNKDRLPKEFKSSVVYHFQCAGCNSSYVG